MRLGVARALVDGSWVDGDVDVDGNAVARVGVSPAGSGSAVPGFVDLQVNGFGGVDFAAADLDGYAAAGRALAATGVVAYQPTLVTGPIDAVANALETLRQARGRVPGPHVIGAHLEGPFLSPARAGTHPVEHLRTPDPGLLERLLTSGPVTQVTLAPELPGALELVGLLAGRGVLVSAGHSDADATTAHAAVAAGTRTVTHLFNAMRPFSHRDPSLPGVALARSDVTVQLIVDGVHLAPEAVLLAWRAAGGRLVLVTDAIAAAGVGDGTCRLGEVEISVRGGEARRGDGVLAGSVLSMDAAVRNLAALGVAPADALVAAAARPAALIGRDDLGVLHPGSAANLVILDDDLAVRQTIIGGRHQW